MRIELDDRLGDWVAEGLIDPAQAERILARERHSTGEGRDDGRSVLAEAVGYLGAVLTVVATGLILGEFWDQLTAWGRLLLAVVLTAAVFAAGRSLRHRRSPAVQRLTSVLWFATSVGVAAIAVLASDELGLDDRTAPVVVSLITALASAGLHRMRQSPLQLIALSVSLGILAISALNYPQASIDLLFDGLVLWGLGVVWLLLGAGGWLRPARTAQVLGLLSIGVGCQTAAFGDHNEIALVLALVSAGALLWIAAVVGDTVMLGFAVAGVFVFVPQAVFTFFGDSIGAPLALLLTGVVLVAAAVGLIVLRREIQEEG